MAKPKGLGRGLDALFGDEVKKEEVQGIKINDIEQNSQQPRRHFDETALLELAESIRHNGVITPIAVRKTGETYQIIAGERRWRASRMAGLSHIPAVVLDVDEQTAYQYALVENLQRQDLNPIEEAVGYQRLMEDFSLTQEQAAERVGKSRSAVANVLRLLSLPKGVREMVEEGRLSAGHARALLGMPNHALMLDAARQVIEQQLSVRQTESLVKASVRQRTQRAPSDNALYIRDLERQMEADTGHKITVQHGKDRGKLTIEYYGNEDLDKICAALKRLGDTPAKG